MYEITQTSSTTYTFTTDSYNVYSIFIEENPNYYINQCVNCKKLLEFGFNCTNPKEALDPKVETTMMNFLLSKLDDCHGIYYRCDNSDGRACVRERKFESWFEKCEENNTNFSYDKTVNEVVHIDGIEYITVKYHLLYDKRCINIDGLYKKHHYECEPCKRNQSYYLDECE